jgi:hypothetical protein
MLYTFTSAIRAMVGVSVASDGTPTRMTGFSLTIFIGHVDNFGSWDSTKKNSYVDSLPPTLNLSQGEMAVL